MNRKFLRLLFVFFALIAPALVSVPAMAQVHMQSCPECDALADEAKRLQAIADQANADWSAARQAEADTAKAEEAAQAAWDAAWKALQQYIRQMDDADKAAKAKAAADAAARLQQVADLDRQIAQLQNDMKRLQGEYDQLTSEIASAQANVDTFNEQLQGYVDEVTAAQQALNDALAAQTAAQQAADSSYRWHDVYDEARTQQTQALQQARANVNTARQNLAQKETSLKNFQAKITQAEGRVTALKNKQNSDIAAYNADQAEIARLQALRKKLSAALPPAPPSYPDSQLQQLQNAEASAKTALDQAQTNHQDAVEASIKAGDAYNTAHKAAYDAYVAWQNCVDDCIHGKHRKDALDGGSSTTGVTPGDGKTGGGGTDGGSGGGTTDGGGTGYVPPDAPPVGGKEPPANKAVCQQCAPYYANYLGWEAEVAVIQSEINSERAMAKAEAKDFDDELRDLKDSLNSLQNERAGLDKGYKAAKKAGIANDAGYAARKADLDQQIADTQAKIAKVDKDYSRWEDREDDYFDDLWDDYDFASAMRDASFYAFLECLKHCKEGTAMPEHSGIWMPGAVINVQVEQVHLISGFNPFDPAEIRSIFGNF